MSMTEMQRQLLEWMKKFKKDNCKERKEGKPKPGIDFRN